MVMMPPSLSSAPCGVNSGRMDELLPVALLDDDFMVQHFKVERCMLSHPHGWKVCPYVHPGEPVRRRHPSTHRGDMCPAVKKGVSCQFGPEKCQWAHNSFELWLHPSRYKTKMCRRGADCPRGTCFFAHSESELRQRIKPANGTNSTSAAAEQASNDTSAISTGIATSAPLTCAHGLSAVQAVQVPAAWVPAPAVQAMMPVGVQAVQASPASWPVAQAVPARHTVMPTAVQAVQTPVNWACSDVLQAPLASCAPVTGCATTAAAAVSSAALQQQLEMLSVVECTAGNGSSSCSVTSSSLENMPIFWAPEQNQQQQCEQQQYEQQFATTRLQQEIELHQLRMQQLQGNMVMLQLLQQQQQQQEQQQQPSFAIKSSAHASKPCNNLVTYPACMSPLSANADTPCSVPASFPMAAATVAAATASMFPGSSPSASAAPTRYTDNLAVVVSAPHLLSW